MAFKKPFWRQLSEKSSRRLACALSALELICDLYAYFSFWADVMRDATSDESVSIVWVIPAMIISSPVCFCLPVLTIAVIWSPWRYRDRGEEAAKLRPLPWGQLLHTFLSLFCWRIHASWVGKDEVFWGFVFLLPPCACCLVTAMLPSIVASFDIEEDSDHYGDSYDETGPLATLYRDHYERQVIEEYGAIRMVNNCDNEYTDEPADEPADIDWLCRDMTDEEPIGTRRRDPLCETLMSGALFLNAGDPQPSHPTEGESSIRRIHGRDVIAVEDSSYRLEEASGDALAFSSNERGESSIAGALSQRIDALNRLYCWSSLLKGDEAKEFAALLSTMEPDMRDRILATVLCQSPLELKDIVRSCPEHVATRILSLSPSAVQELITEAKNISLLEQFDISPRAEQVANVQLLPYRDEPDAANNTMMLETNGGSNDLFGHETDGANLVRTHRPYPAMSNAGAFKFTIIIVLINAGLCGIIAAFGLGATVLRGRRVHWAQILLLATPCFTYVSVVLFLASSRTLHYSLVIVSKAAAMVNSLLWFTAIIASPFRLMASIEAGFDDWPGVCSSCHPLLHAINLNPYGPFEMSLLCLFGMVLASIYLICVFDNPLYKASRDTLIELTR